MEFTLIYRGPLKSRSSPEEKQNIRRFFHWQFRKLWTLPPLSHYTKIENDYLDERNPQGFIQKFSGFNFVPLVNQKFKLVAEIKLILLRPEPPGFIITNGGDIDNRLKTLFDALKMPKDINELPKNDRPRPDENPFFCLLEDDKLITKVSIETDTLLEPGIEPPNVELLIHVKTKVISYFCDNINLS